jgi:hypothetical protein
VSRHPTTDALLSLATDDWSALLPLARRALRGVDERLRDPAVERVLALPPGRLAAGRGREQLARLLVRPDVWARVEAGLAPDHPRPWTSVDDGATDTPEPDDGTAQELAALGQRVERLDERLRTTRGERDAAREAAERAARDAQAAEELAAAAELERLELAERVATAERRVAAAADERTREQGRARRREEASLREQAETLAAARREVDELRREVGRLREQLAARPAAPTGPGAGAPAPRRRTSVQDGHGRAGRPSVLPSGLTPGTTPAVEWLLGAGRLVLVDGYNVTLTRRDDLGLEGQRRWLVDGCTALVARRGVEVVVVFDADRGTASSSRARRGVSVRFTAAGLTADDELEFEVEALPHDRPVVVVTDDAGLRDRLRPYGVDLLHTSAFVPLLR